MTAPAPRLLFATPDLFGPIGGIARISRATALAMASWARARGGHLEVLALCDEVGTAPDPTYAPPEVVSYRAFGGDRRGLGLAVAKAGWRPGHAGTVFGHVNLAVTGLLQPPWARQALVAHGIEIWDPFPRRRLDRVAALRRQQAIWAISRYTASRVEASHRVPAHRVRVIPNGLDPEWRPHSGDVRLAASPPRLLAVCSLARGFEYKGIDVAIEALAALDAGQRPLLDVVGDGEDRARLERLARTLGVSEHVVFHGRVDDAALTRLYASAYAFVLPSTREGFGLVFVEAMAHALPVITVSAGAAPEVVEDGVTGRVVPPSDPRALAGAIAALTSAPELALTMGHAGAERARALYTFPSYEARIHAALDALVR